MEFSGRDGEKFEKLSLCKFWLTCGFCLTLSTSSVSFSLQDVQNTCTSTYLLSTYHIQLLQHSVLILAISFRIHKN